MDEIIEIGIELPKAYDEISSPALVGWELYFNKQSEISFA